MKNMRNLIIAIVIVVIIMAIGLIGIAISVSSALSNQKTFLGNIAPIIVIVVAVVPLYFYLNYRDDNCIPKSKTDKDDISSD